MILSEFRYDQEKICTFSIFGVNLKPGQVNKIHTL